MASLGVLFLVTGCGGAKKAAEEPVSEAPAPVEEDSEDEPVLAEKLDELTRTFRLKRQVVARCYADAVEAGSIDKAAKGRVSLVMSISADGRASDVKVTSSTLRNKSLEGCIVDMIESWDLPAPGSRTEFSFSYDFEPE